MIEGREALAIIAASRQAQDSLVIMAGPRQITEARHYLEDHGAVMGLVHFCTPDTLHQARGFCFDVVAVDSYARMRAREDGRSEEFDNFVKSVRRG